jgi:hypothetical protein
MISRAGTIVISQAVRTRAAEAKVRERVAEGNCVSCPSDDVRKHVKRGLCVRCDARFNEEMAKLGSEQERAEFEAEAYRQGAILNPQEIRELKSEISRANVFAEIRKSIKKR